MRRRLSSRDLFVVAALLLAATLANGCASLSSLGSVVQPPRFAQAPDRPAELRVGPSSASIRLWALVENPNPFGVLLDRLDGTFFLEDRRAAAVDFPLGLDLGARDEAVVPLDIPVDFDDVSGLADVLRRAVGARELGYRIEGTVGVDAGPLGDLTYGPTDLIEGEIDADDVVR